MDPRQPEITNRLPHNDLCVETLFAVASIASTATMLDMARRPTAQELAAARNKTIPDVLAPGLAVVFCGINPGLYSGAVGHHFARPGNRFWPALHQAGWTDRQLNPTEDVLLPRYGCGVTNLVARTTATATELTDEELARGGQILRRKIARYRPRCLAILGIDAYRKAMGVRKATVGQQPLTIHDSRVWLLPNPSGLNAHYQLPDFVHWMRRLREECSG
mgnify:CR=1 FL=1